MSSSNPTLCPIVQGVTFSFQHSGRTVRALVASNVLEAAFDAAPEPSAWLRCFREHEALIVGVARQLFEQEEFCEPVVVREKHLPAPARPDVARLAAEAARKRLPSAEQPAQSA